MKQPPKKYESFDYIVIDELPLQQQEPFFEWLKGKTMVCIEREKENKYKCAYYHDYSRWYDAWIKIICQ